MRDQLNTLFQSVRLSKFGTRKIVITPYNGLAVPFMGVAWDVQRDFPSFDLQAMVAFYDRRVDTGPEDEP